MPLRRMQSVCMQMLDPHHEIPLPEPGLLEFPLHLECERRPPSSGRASVCARSWTPRQHDLHLVDRPNV